MLTPSFDDNPGLLQRVEDLAIEQLVAELRIEALAIAVLPRTAGLTAAPGSDHCQIRDRAPEPGVL
ncbi:hypothetical protein X772_36915 [Mesorhizobium sp. LSJC280B00]|nr:hypothetical protein X772_36915 [Mesorhizobium sp. LSJC280B00]